MGQFNLKYFEDVNRLSPTLEYESGWDTPCAEMFTSQGGEYVLHSDYLELLSAYKELKHRMEGLEK